MQKQKGFTIVEIAVTLLIIFGVASFIVPIAMDNTKQAHLISDWSEEFNNIKYTFSVIQVQMSDEVEYRLENIQTPQIMEATLWELMKPYLRIKMAVQEGTYKPQYKHKVNVVEDDQYVFKNYYFTENNKIISLKWLDGKCDVIACARMMFDVNGIVQPNTWGKDIFGINLYKDRIEPFGYGLDYSMQKSECNTMRGLYCSSYYLMGGKFD